MQTSTELGLGRLHHVESAAIVARANAAEHCHNLGWGLTPRTNLRDLASALIGGDVRPWPNLSRQGRRLAGALEAGGALVTIFYEAYDPPVRQRFSMAHELGHFYLHEDAALPASKAHLCTETDLDGQDVDDVHSPNKPHSHVDAEHDLVHIVREQEANAFAAAFLLPAEDLVADLDHFGCCVAFLAERYVVSEAALRTRLRTLKHLRRL